MSLPFAAPKWHSSRLVYRAYREGDDQLIRRLYSDPQTLRDSMGWALHPITGRRVKEMSEMAKTCTLSVIVCLPSSPDSPTSPGTPIGWVALRGPPKNQEQHRCASFGTVFLKEYQGKGYGTEALEWVFEQAFQRFGVHRIEGGVFGFNTQARKSYQKLGFKEEVVQRKSFWNEGEFHDSIEIALLEDEWRERRGKSVAIVS